MGIIVVGLSHKTAAIEVREKLNFPESTLPDALRKLMAYEGVRESLIVSTCNRVEIYASVQESAKGIDRIKQFISDYHGLSREALEQSLYVYPDAQGVRHTFRVASSLDSMVLGEAQILGQLKDAFDIALKTKTTSTILNKLIKKAISVAKRVRTETKLAEGAVSISSAAVELAKKIFGELEGKNVMLLGAGEMAELAAQHLLGNGVKNIMVANRTFERAEELAKDFKGDAIRFEHFPDALMMVDILICATGAPNYVVNRDMAGRALKERRHKPIFMIDISNPRNIDPEVDKVDNVYLYDIDDLQSKVDVNTEGRAREAGKAEEIVMQEVETYLAWERALDAVPTIVDLREKVEDVRKRELEKTLGFLNGITEDQKRAVEAMSQAIVNKLLHAPLVVLKQAASAPDAGDNTIAVARKLFNLDRELKRPTREKVEELPDRELPEQGSGSKSPCR
ncbi:MAG TPA: glutamyl-tRNA reductase [Nitrospirota bacterium]|nr:glutamyl-tRNA reductase [Nitrospirota bacterium]